jgi:CobQ-like glutamine amidotransferase family enzyme
LSARGAASRLGVVVVYPDLLGTYGDRGNALVLAARARARGVDVEVVEVEAEAPLPRSAELYCIGGGEDAPQVEAARRLAADDGLPEALAAGATLLAICAGMQVIGREFPGPGGKPTPGVGLLGVRTRPALVDERRAVGEVLARPTLAARPLVEDAWLSGFENHAGRTLRDPGVSALGEVVAGVGNGDGASGEGALAEGIVGTYLHGPVLARNPALADALLARALGRPLEPLEWPEVELLRAERLLAAKSGRRSAGPLRSRLLLDQARLRSARRGGRLGA